MDFKEMTLLQLKAYAKEKGIRGISTLKKEQLVEKLMKSEKYEEKREEKKEENIEVKREENRKENKRANKEERTLSSFFRTYSGFSSQPYRERNNPKR